MALTEHGFASGDSETSSVLDHLGADTASLPDSSADTAAQEPFDFSAHGQAAVSAYLERRDFFDDLASLVKRVLEECLKHDHIKVHFLEARAKDPRSFERKAREPSEADPTRPKYREPLKEITDLAGVRVITYFPSTVDELDKLISREFVVIERSDKGAARRDEEAFGYQSIHFLVKLSARRAPLPEYAAFANNVTEIQIRTILQHAWAEIEHDIQYKSPEAIPRDIRRRFMSLAGMLELADREFQSIQDADRTLAETARKRVGEDNISEVEITPDSLKAYLDRRIGPDARISAFSYDWTVRLLKRLGFRTLAQVDKCIEGYDDDALSRAATGSRQGQLERFQFMVLAGVGDRFLLRHPLAEYGLLYLRRFHSALENFVKRGIPIRNYDPTEA